MLPALSSCCGAHRRGLLSLGHKDQQRPGGPVLHAGADSLGVMALLWYCERFPGKEGWVQDSGWPTAAQLLAQVGSRGTRTPSLPDPEVSAPRSWALQPTVTEGEDNPSTCWGLRCGNLHFKVMHSLFILLFFVSPPLQREGLSLSSSPGLVPPNSTCCAYKGSHAICTAFGWKAMKG